MINLKYISQMLYAYDETKLSINEHGEIIDDNIHDYLEHVINDLINIIHQNTLEYLETRQMNALIRSDNAQVNIGCLFLTLSQSIYDYILHQYNAKSIEHEVFCGLTRYTITAYQDIISSLINNSYDGILPRLRSLYENFIVMLYISKHKQLSQLYYNHGYIVHYKMLKELGYIEENEITLKRNELIKKHNFEYEDDYGWTYPVILNRKNRKLITMVQELELTAYNNLYKITCEYVHPSPFIVFSENQNNFIELFNGPIIEILTQTINVFVYEMNASTRDKVILKEILLRLRNLFYNIDDNK